MFSNSIAGVLSSVPILCASPQNILCEPNLHKLTTELKYTLLLKAIGKTLHNRIWSAANERKSILIRSYLLPYIWRKRRSDRIHAPSIFIVALFETARRWKQAKCPLAEGWIKKMWYIYTAEYYSAMKKKKAMPFAATCLVLEMIILSDRSQKEKYKFCIVSLICGI